MTNWRDDYPEGQRVRAVEFTIDPGTRIWPMQDDSNLWRVVFVRGAHAGDYDTLFAGTQSECEARHPDATYSINDNESVPPGTLGTVDHQDSHNLFVKWDNGRRLGVNEDDRIERV
jgi:hypothetical protein